MAWCLVKHGDFNFTSTTRYSDGYGDRLFHFVFFSMQGLG